MCQHTHTHTHDFGLKSEDLGSNPQAATINTEQDTS